MGMFDSLYVTCRKCGKDVEFQSKAGECYLNRYTLENVPPAVAGDLIEQVQTCSCGNSICLRGSVTLMAEQTG
jgi:hypothetical protein